MNESTGEQNLIVERQDGWMRIWFNRPEVRNALSNDVIDELIDVLTPVREDRSVRGISFRGKGGVFCAGGDIKGFKAVFQGGSDVADIMRASSKGGQLFHLINEMPQVVVMLVEGAAIAGGLGIMCTGDVVIVTEDAKFAISETSIGIPPAQIAPFVVQRIGLASARRLMLTGARFDGRHALQVGLADQLAADAAGLDETEAEIIKGVRRCAPGANPATKRIVHAAGRLEKDDMIAFAAKSFADCMLSEEGREGVASFLEKRKPSWAE